MFLDVATIYCKAGNGGDGRTSFLRAKYVPKGGPDGGDGGRGGNIYVQASPSLNTLSSFRYKAHYRAANGEKGDIKNLYGRAGEDMLIFVPRGTIIKDAESGGIIADVFDYDKKVLLLAGGKGGRGNARFATPTRRSPAFSELGEKTMERKLRLELKTIADVGLVGFPNVGKSTLLSVISAARPKIADYPFTTLTPNLGVVDAGDSSFVAADIPGLIEGAADGAGLGHSFLRHIERVRLIVHLVDISGSEGRNPVDDYKIIRAELEKYSKSLAALPEIVVANKSDIGADAEALKALEETVGANVIEISAATTQGIKELVDTIARTLVTLPPLKPFEFEPFVYTDVDKSEFFVEKRDDCFFVGGGMIEEIARKTVLSDQESSLWFQKMLRDRGVIDELKKQGMQDGDTVQILDFTFEYLD